MAELCAQFGVMEGNHIGELRILIANLLHRQLIAQQGKGSSRFMEN